MAQINGGDRSLVTIIADGEDMKYLLLSVEPVEQDQLQELFAAYQLRPDFRTRLCMEGFQEAQFIVRDSSGQRLLGKVVPTVSETSKYMVMKTPHAEVEQ
jgi:hypothetical protein